jgi:cysteine desulfurase
MGSGAWRHYRHAVGTYLDAASGAPMHPIASEALAAALDDGWADPARLHGAGRRAAVLLEAARESIAANVGARADELSFAGNGTQAMHAAVLGTLAGNRGARTLVHSAVEHSAALHAAEFHTDAGGSAVAIGVDAAARVDAAAFAAALRQPGVAAGALQAANHEVGTTQPVTALAGDSPVPLIVDASQVIGHADVPTGWSVLTGDARNWGGPDVGLLAVRTGTRWRSPAPADDRGRIPGTVNLPAVFAAAASLRAVLAEREATAALHRDLIDLIRGRVTAIPDVEVLGDPVDRLPHIVTFSCLYVDGEALLTRLDALGFEVSSGSSCTSSSLEPSHVLVAMGALTSGNIRISLHQQSTLAEVEAFLAVLPDAVATVRAELGAAGL